MKTPYEILEIPVNASSSQIKEAFRKKAKATHPDLNSNDTRAHEKFIEVSNSYGILSDPYLKSKLDKKINGFDSYDSVDYRYEPEINTRDISDMIRSLILQMYREVEPYKAQAKKALWIGLAWFLGGLIITFLSYSESVSSGTDSYTITYGAILFGLIQAVRGFIANTKINKAILDYEKDLWSKFDEIISG